MRKDSLKVAIAGASGFVGEKLIQVLLEETNWNIIGLSRTKKKGNHSRLEWRRADLFSLLQTEKALEDADIAFYLVHSMLPSAHLDQGSFEDYDLLLADNFSRACSLNAVKKVVYLGGILPRKGDLSPHLRSRYEVETIFTEKDFTFTAVRAGLILGEKGSSFSIMYNLVERLPILVCPSWTKNPMTPIDVDDASRILKEVAQLPSRQSQVYEIGGPKTYSYYELLKICAKKMQKKRGFFRFPLPIIGVSKFWVRLFSGKSKELVYPLLDSLKSPMNIHEEDRFNPQFKTLSFEESLEKILKRKSKNQSKRRNHVGTKKQRKTVRSVQRMPLPNGFTAVNAAEEYMRWLPHFLFPLVLVKVEQNHVSFALVRRSWVILKLFFSEKRSGKKRSLFYIKGGLLARRSKKGRLEFRQVIDDHQMIVAIHDYYPSLPWFIYRYTQAQVHLWVMKRFASHLKKQEH